MKINFIHKKLRVLHGRNFISDLTKDPGYQFRQKMFKVHTEHFEQLKNQKLITKPEKS